MPRESEYSVEEFGRDALRTRLDVLLAELGHLRQETAPDRVHDARVASRRMRAALEMFEDLLDPEEYQDAYASVRFITRTLGKPREVGVLVSMLQELTSTGDMAENLCREYLQERFRKRLDKHERRMGKQLAKVDPKTLRTRMRSLIAGLGTRAKPGRTAAGTRKRRARAAPEPDRQPTLFFMREDGRDRARRILAELGKPIAAFPADAGFARAPDPKIHGLRIAAKKLRYAMEINDPIWPDGLREQIEQARALQDAGGNHHDWCVLCDELKDEIRRLDKRQSEHMRFQIGRLLVQANNRRKSLRKVILPELIRLQSMLPPAATGPGAEPGTAYKRERVTFPAPVEPDYGTVAPRIPSKSRRMRSITSR